MTVICHLLSVIISHPIHSSLTFQPSLSGPASLPQVFPSALRSAILRVALCVLPVAIPQTLNAQALQPPSTGGAVALAQELRFLGHYKRVLMIAAHPDDEYTELLTLLARGMGVETAYLSLNRGEGGQNLIGNELGEELGVLRTGELLASRQLDGARQYFTRAYDFGFSKTQDDTWAHWPKDSVLKDAVQVVRQFRPQVIISIFSGTPRDGHGQHQAAGWIAQEVFRIAGDSTRFPGGWRAWTPSKLYRSTRFDTAGTTLVLQGGVVDAAVGQSYRQIAARGRSFHRSQDMGQLQDVGASRITLQLMEDRTGAGGGLFDGIDTSVVAASHSLPALTDLQLHTWRATLMQFGVQLDATVSDGSLVPGQDDSLTITAWNSSATELEIDAVPSASWQATPLGSTATGKVGPGETRSWKIPFTVPSGATPSRPYFLAQPRDGDLYRWGPAASGDPFEPPLMSVEFTVRGGGQKAVVAREVAYRYNDQARGEVRLPVTIVPRLDLKLDPQSAVWRAGDSTPQRFTVTITHNITAVSEGRVRLELPQGWRAVPPQPFRLARERERKTFTFLVRPPSVNAGIFSVRAVAVTGNDRDSLGVTTIDYPHVRPRQLVRAAEAAVRIAPLSLPALRRVGYVRGAADRVPEALQQVGLPVTLLTGLDLESKDLSSYQAIIIGPRAFETDPELPAANDQLLDYVKRGGLVITQYQQYGYFLFNYAPYSMTVGGRSPGATTSAALSRDSTKGSAPPTTATIPTALLGGHDRVTDEHAAVTVVDAASAILRTPNRISAPDWDGWVQERGLYFARSWDKEWKPVLSMHDPGESALEGGLLVSKVGKGTYVYTGLSFFRQLPAGVPGAFRLFSNLLALASPASR